MEELPGELDPTLLRELTPGTAACGLSAFPNLPLPPSYHRLSPHSDNTELLSLSPRKLSSSKLSFGTCDVKHHGGLLLTCLNRRER